MLGFPMDLGAGRRGVDMGPAAIRYAGLAESVKGELDLDFEDLGDVDVPVPAALESGPGPKYLKEIVSACESLAPRVESILDEERFPVVIGGDHSMAMGTVTGVASHFRKKNEKIGMVWIDAHADFNTGETSPSGNVHGMPLAALMGYGPSELVNIGGFTPKVDPENTVLIGIRSVDDGERELVMASGLHHYEMMRIDAMGIAGVVEEAIALATRGTAGVHISLDMDGIDPACAPGVGTPVAGGISMRESYLLMEMLADSGRLVSMEVAELNPILDSANATAELACEMITSALGKKVMGPLSARGQRRTGRLWN
jgi:arginase